MASPGWVIFVDLMQGESLEAWSWSSTEILLPSHAFGQDNFSSNSLFFLPKKRFFVSWFWIPELAVSTLLSFMLSWYICVFVEVLAEEYSSSHTLDPTMIFFHLWKVIPFSWVHSFGAVGIEAATHLATQISWVSLSFGFADSSSSLLFSGCLLGFFLICSG